MSRAIIAIFLVFVFAAYSSACSWDYPIWIPRSPDADALYRFEKAEDRSGYIDRTGKVVIPPKIKGLHFNAGDEFHSGLLQVRVAEAKFLDTTGKSVTYKNFYLVEEFSEGLAPAMEKEIGLWGYINTEGRYVISPRFASGNDEYVWPFEDGLAQIKTNGRYGYIDRSGSFVIAPNLLDADSFHEGLARVVIEGPCFYVPQEPCASPRFPGLSSEARPKNPRELPRCKFTFVDKSGRVLDKRYEGARYFSEGLAPVQIDGKWGYIGKSGELVIAARFDEAEPFSDGMGLVKQAGLYGFIDKSGVYVIAPQFKWAEGFVEGHAVVGDDYWQGPLWYIDHQGNQVFRRKFVRASSFFKGLAHVQLVTNGSKDDKEHFEYIDHNGRTVFAYSW